MAVNHSLNNKVSELFKSLLEKHLVTGQADFCKKIDYETASFSHVLSNRRSFPKSKVPVLVTVFDLDRSYFNEFNYAGKNTIGDKVRFIRETLGYSQMKFAKEIGVKQGTVSAIETGTNTPSFNFIWTLINKFKVNPYFIFTDEQIVFDSGKKFSNRSKVDNIISYAKKIIDEGGKITW